MTAPPSQSLTQFDRELMAFMREDERRKKEAVSPKMELARNFKGKIIIAKGGRSAGAKTTSMVSLAVQRSHRMRRRVACLREIQESLEESLYHAVEKQVDYLEYPGWKFPRSQGFISTPMGERWIFKGLKDLRAARNTKGLDDIDEFIVDEGATIIGESWDILIPLLGKKQGSQLWAAFNPETESDPIFTKLWVPYLNDPDALLLDMLPEGADNPWWNADAQKMSDKLRREDEDLWLHVYGGQPKKQGERSVLARVDIREAMDRELPIGYPVELGIDVARFGDDKTTFYKREGMKITDYRIVNGFDTQEVARIGWDMVKRDPNVPIKVDVTGVGAGVVDKLRDMGARVIEIEFGGKPTEPDKYTSVADEMWFGFQEILGQIDIPNDPLLMEELSGRHYEYQGDKRKIESKKDFKKRMGRSPDRADGLLLAFYAKQNTLKMSDDVARQLARRRMGQR